MAETDAISLGGGSTAFTVIIFALVYLAMALGKVPGFKVDRAGAALIGALALLVADVIHEKEAWIAVDFATMALLFGLMVVSAQFTMSGFYTAVTERLATVEASPVVLLGVIVFAVGTLSALLTNNVVAVAMAPLLVNACAARRLNPVPFLLALGFAANAGSVATIIGSPQNMIIATRLNLPFVEYTVATIVPAAFALVVVWAVLALLYRGRWVRETRSGLPVAAIPFNRGEATKGLVVAALVLCAFIFTGANRVHVALAAAGVLLLNRRFASRDMLREVDGGLLIMLFGLFIVNAAFAATGLPDQVISALSGRGVDLTNSGWVFALAAALSDIVGNTPAAILLGPYIDGIPDGIAVTLASGFSSNLIVFGSLATIIVVEAAKERGVVISFGEFSRAGVPIALVTLAFGFLWVMLVVQ